MALFQNLRNRVNAAVAAAVGAVLALICGALMAFVISPQMALEWRRIQNLPELDAGSFAATATGEDVAITGKLDGNSELTAEGLVVYIRESWDVTPPSDSSDSDAKPTGRWEEVETNAPALAIAISGGTVETVPATSLNIGGNLHETIARGRGPESADYNGQNLPEGSERTRGFRNGDLVTIVGRKASTGGLAPNRIFGGDRVQLVEDIRGGARALFLFGVAMMICSPLILVAGILSGLFGRRRAT